MKSPPPVLPALALAIALGSAFGESRLEAADTAPPPPGLGARTYSTRFSLSENPISEGAKWLNGKATGLDWADVATTGGFAYGLEGGMTGYDDSTALLSGPWGPNQTAEATVHTTNQNAKVWEEVELRLRSSLAPHRATGYEILFSCRKTNDAYSDIVRWDGPLSKFTYLSHKDGAQYGVKDGDIVRATINGNVITAYINGVEVARATDSTFASGSPGMGFFLQGASGLNRDYGFTRFSATDAPVATAGPASR
jgi:hypothetical protein